MVYTLYVQNIASKEHFGVISIAIYSATTVVFGSGPISSS